MLLGARLTNLIFFTLCFFFIIKSSKIGKWSLFMLFSVPFLQKLASPSYDVFSYIAVSAFMVNVLHLAALKSFQELNRKRILYTCFTILLILCSKNNYIFSLFTLIVLPMVLTPIIDRYKQLSNKKKFFLSIIILLFLVIFIYYLNRYFNLRNFTKIFINNYLNVETMNRRGQSLFNIVSVILPDLFNILWILSIFFVMIGEKKYDRNKAFIFGSGCTFLLNWVGIYAGFYLILQKPTTTFDELSGRYLYPYIICFLPLTQYLNYRYKFQVSKKAIQTVAFISTFFIMVSYLVTCYYRGYILYTTPTWTN